MRKGRRRPREKMKRRETRQKGREKVMEEMEMKGYKEERQQGTRD